MPPRRLLRGADGHLLRRAAYPLGFGDDVAKVKEAWSAGGSKAGTDAVSPKILAELAYIGPVEGAVERLRAQDEAGVDLHPVDIDAGGSAAEFEKIVSRLL